MKPSITSTVIDKTTDLRTYNSGKDGMAKGKSIAVLIVVHETLFSVK